MRPDSGTILEPSVRDQKQNAAGQYREVPFVTSEQKSGGQPRDRGADDNYENRISDAWHTDSSFGEQI